MTQAAENEQTLFEGHPAVIGSATTLLLVVLTLGLWLLVAYLQSIAKTFRITTKRIVVETGILGKRLEQIDLYRVSEHQLIKIEVPVHFKNHETSVGLKKGGTLEVIRHVVELACPADKIPEELVIDLASHDIGDVIRISEVKLPEGVRPAMDRDFVIANLKASAASQSNEGDTTTAEA